MALAAAPRPMFCMSGESSRAARGRASSRTFDGRHSAPAAHGELMVVPPPLLLLGL